VILCALFLAISSLSSRGADQLKEIKTRGVLRWGGDAEGGAPYVYPDPQKPEHLIGFECDLAEALAAKLGVKAKMVQNQWDQLVPALERGNFDIILNGLELTPDNQQRIAMSLPYFIYAEQIVTRRYTDGLARIEDLKTKPVGVLSSSVAQRLLEEMRGVDLRIYPGNVESLRDLRAKRIEAVVMDLPIALHYARSDPALKLSGASFAPGYYGIGVRKPEVSLLAVLNQAITELQQEHALERIWHKALKLPKLGIEVSFVDDPDNLDDWRAAIRPNTKLLFAETLGNPRGNVLDTRAVADVAHEAGVPLIVDNTVPTPYLLRPIEHGADIVVHSATKFIGGHGTSIGGVIVDSGKFPWDKGHYPHITEPSKQYHGVKFHETFGSLAYIIKCRVDGLRDFGGSMAPFNSFLFIQGLETLPLRMQAHSKNGLAVAKFLEGHKSVTLVNDPGLESSVYRAESKK